MPYKVLVDLGEQGGQSAIVMYAARVLYTKGEWVTAPEWLARKGYHLTFFEWLEDAEHFCSCGSKAIWQCEVEDILDKLPQMCRFSVDDGKIEPQSIYRWPRGTKMAKRIKLTRRIK